MPFLLNPQHAVKGSVVNIPVEINDMVNILSRKFDEMCIIQLNLKRDMKFSGHYPDYIRLLRSGRVAS